MHLRPERLFLACVSLMIAAGCAAPRTHFGEPMRLASTQPLTVGHILADPEHYDGRYVRVHGTITVLCAHSGCWMKLAHNAKDEREGLIVLFTYDREKYRLPPEAKGHAAVVEGTVVIAETPEATRRHRAEEQGMSAEEVAKIVGPERSVRLKCPAATVFGVKPGTPAPCKHEEKKQ